MSWPASHYYPASVQRAISDEFNDMNVICDQEEGIFKMWYRSCITQMPRIACGLAGARMRPEGGYTAIALSGGGNDVPFANLEAALNAFVKHGKYDVP